MDTISSDGQVGGEATGKRRRRTYTLEEKQGFVAESDAAGASVSLVARRHDINANLLFTWRRQLRPPALAGSLGEFIPIEIIGAQPPLAPAIATEAPSRAAIEIVLACGVRVHVDNGVSEAALKRVILVLKASA
jgi:transposase